MAVTTRAKTKKKTLDAAELLARQRRFTEVISMLESQVFLFRDNPRYFFLLAYACLQTNDVGGAYSYAKRSVDIEPRSVEGQLLLAAVHLRRREYQDTIRIWLAVLDEDPRNNIARKGLLAVRKADDSALEDISVGKKLTAFCPVLRWSPPPMVLPIVLGLAITAAGIAVGWYTELPKRLWDYWESVRNVESRLGSESIRNVAVTTVESVDGAYFDLSDAELSAKIGDIGRFFNQRRDNLARKIANEIFLSNASDLVKQRVGLLTTYFSEPTFADFSDGFSYTQVAENPLLYEDTFVRWSGVAANIEATAERVRFDLLLGYERGRVVVAVIPVTFDFAIRVAHGTAIELIGQVVLADQQHLGLRGTAIRFLEPAP